MADDEFTWDDWRAEAAMMPGGPRGIVLRVEAAADAVHGRMLRLDEDGYPSARMTWFRTALGMATRRKRRGVAWQQVADALPAAAEIAAAADVPSGVRLWMESARQLLVLLRHASEGGWEPGPAAPGPPFHHEGPSDWIAGLEEDAERIAAADGGGGG